MVVKDWKVDAFARADLIFICYPKTGSSWLEIMLCRYLALKYRLELESIKNVYKATKLVDGIRTCLRTHDDDPQLKLAHKISEDKSMYADKHVLLLVRDPRDIVNSYFHWYTGHAINRTIDFPPFEGGVDDFLFHPVGGLPSVVRFHNVWARNRAAPKSFHVVSYEALHADLAAHLTDVLNFIGEKVVDVNLLRDAIEFGRFENMREIEKGEGVPGLRRPPYVAADQVQTFKTRVGKVGSHRTDWSPRTMAAAKAYLQAKLDPFYQNYWDLLS